MKQIFLPLLAMIFLFSCGSEGWTADEENGFLKHCVLTAEKKTNNDVAKKYCDCMLQKLKKAYPSYEEANLGILSDKNKMQQFAMDCKPKSNPD